MRAVSSVLFSATADTANPATSSYEIPVVVREMQCLDVAQTRTPRTDTASREAALDIVKHVALHAASSLAIGGYRTTPACSPLAVARPSAWA